MDELNIAFKVVLWLLASLGGGGAIIIGFSNFIGKILAKRFEEKIRAQYENEINTFKSQLDILKEVNLRYSNKQFDHYHKLWSNLYDLKILADDLWLEASSFKMDRFSKQLKSTKIEIEKISLFIEDDHYKELTELIRQFSEYNIGKRNLIQFRQGDNYDIHEGELMIANNGNTKARFDQVLLLVKAELKRQIRGEA